MVLSCLTCGGAANRIADAIMWFSSGGTKSVLHFDAVDNINCVLDGWKEVVLIDKVPKDWSTKLLIIHALNILTNQMYVIRMNGLLVSVVWVSSYSRGHSLVSLWTETQRSGSCRPS